LFLVADLVQQHATHDFVGVGDVAAADERDGGGELLIAIAENLAGGPLRTTTRTEIRA
jgi:hypothetical protein